MSTDKACAQAITKVRSIPPLPAHSPTPGAFDSALVAKRAYTPHTSHPHMSRHEATRLDYPRPPHCALLRSCVLLSHALRARSAVIPAARPPHSSQTTWTILDKVQTSSKPTYLRGERKITSLPRKGKRLPPRCPRTPCHAFCVLACTRVTCAPCALRSEPRGTHSTPVSAVTARSRS